MMPRRTRAGKIVNCKGEVLKEPVFHDPSLRRAYAETKDKIGALSKTRGDENQAATSIEPGAIVVAKFPHDGLMTAIALCLIVSLKRDKAIVRKAMGGSSMGFTRHGKWRWATAREIPREQICRLSTARERSVRHVIGGAAGEKLTGDGAGAVR